MDSETVLTVGFVIVAALHIALGGAFLLRSRNHRGPISWRGRPVAAPRLAASGYLLAGLMFAAMAIRDVFAPRSVADDLLFFAGNAFAVASLVTLVVWLARPQRRGATSQPGR